MELTPISEALVKSIREFLREQIDTENNGCWAGNDPAACDLLDEVLLHSTGEGVD